MFRVYTEDTNRPGIERILDGLFDGYTLIPADGVWHGQHEHSLVIELDGVDLAKVREAATQIKSANHQQAVLIEQITTESQLV